MRIQNQTWLKFSEELPRPMSGYIAASHPEIENGRPQMVFVGNTPSDYRLDGYTLWYPIPDRPRF